MFKLLFVVNTAGFFLSHRLPIALAAREEGYEVHIATGSGDEEQGIIELGFIHHRLDQTRSGQNPFIEIKYLFQLYRLYKIIKPDLVHLITIKPILYGGIVARITNVRSVVVAVSGLGTVFVARNGISAIRYWIVSSMYRIALKHQKIVVILQNASDQAALLKIRAIKLNQVVLIPGSGVDLEEYPFKEETMGKPVVVMASRLLRDKGVYEFVEAAKILKSWGTEVSMRLIGAIDDGNPSSVTPNEIDHWIKEGYVEILGFREDIAEQYSAANIVCLPSYREGLPKGLVEAAACGRAVVTTDVPGCRDSIIPTKTGLLVPVRNAPAIANALLSLLKAPKRRREMGLAGRKLAEEKYDIKSVVARHLGIYSRMLS